MTKDKSDREKHGRDSVVDGELWKCTKWHEIIDVQQHRYWHMVFVLSM